jgi:hypothetical protein
MGQRSSIHLADDLAAAVKASGTPLAELVRRGLGAGSCRKLIHAGWSRCTGEADVVRDNSRRDAHVTG